MRRTPKPLNPMPLPGEWVQKWDHAFGRWGHRGIVLGYASGGMQLNRRGRVRDGSQLTPAPTSPLDLLYADYGSYDAGVVPNDHEIRVIGGGQLALNLWAHNEVCAR